jgi:uncharacterized protein YbjT (DUF2867 family)
MANASAPVLVIGATGLLGEPVARGLLAAGFGVRVMSRDAARARNTFSAPFEIAEGDALRRADVERALAGCGAVHISVDHAREGDAVACIIDAGRATGLERVTYVSGSTVCEANGWFPLVARKLEAEAAIRAGGIPYTIFCPGWFMEMLGRFVRGGRAIVFGKPERRWHFVAVADFARMVVASYRQTAALDRRLYVHGPQALNIEEALRAYCRALHPEISPRSTPFWLLRLMARLTRNAGMRYAVDLMAYFERVGERGAAAEANAILGAPRLTLDAWLEQQRVARVRR